MVKSKAEIETEEILGLNKKDLSKELKDQVRSLEVSGFSRFVLILAISVLSGLGIISFTSFWTSFPLIPNISLAILLTIGVFVILNSDYLARLKK